MVSESIKGTYTKFIEQNATTYLSALVSQETLTYSDWEKGELVEIREYSDKFADEFETTTEFSTDTESNLKTLSITNQEIGQQTEVDALPFLITDPASIDWETELVWDKIAFK